MVGGPFWVTHHAVFIFKKGTKMAQKKVSRSADAYAGSAAAKAKPKTATTSRRGASADAAAGKASAKNRSDGMARLKELGNYLGAKDVQGKSSADSRGRVSKQREKDFLNSYYTKRGGGQGKSAPKASSYPSAPKKRRDVRGNIARARSNQTPSTR